MEIQKNVPLKNYTTFKIGGKAKYFFAAKNKDEIIKAVKWTKDKNLPFFIFGGGSNLLVSDEGYNGLVIKNRASIYDGSEGEDEDEVLIATQNSKIICEAGTPLSFLVSKGLEWAIGIPGTVGGAIYGNAGAFGQSMKDVVETVEVFDAETEKIKVFKNKDCQFAYRDSVFKRNKNLIIVLVKIKLRNPPSLKLRRARIKKYLNYKKETQPLNFPSAGSVFKNPKGFSAGELIERCGLKGKKIGDVAISEKHGNFIINLGQGKAEDVKKLINFIKKSVKNKFGIILEEEIQFL